MRHPLPNLNALRAFEAVTRHLTFTRAARDLNVQQPAISRQIADLEDDLGTKLFRRTKPRLTLTPDGERLASAVSHGFGHIAQTVAQIRGQGMKPTLAIDVSIGFASCWLLSRIADFQGRYPDVDVQITTRDANDAYDRDQSDVIILFGEGREAGLEATRIFPEELFAICAPDYLPDGTDLSPAELPSQRLLSLRDSLHGRDWALLLEPEGLSVPPSGPGQEYNSFIVYLQAILNGEGIGLGWGRLLDDLIAARRLRRVTTLTRHTARGYHCALPTDRPPSPEAEAFVDWIVKQATG